MPNSKLGKVQENKKIIPNSVDACNKPILVVNYDGKNYVSVTSVAHNMGLDAGHQRKLVQNHPIMSKHYEYFDITLKSQGLDSQDKSFGSATNPTAIRDEKKLIGANLGSKTFTHLFLEYEFLYGLLFLTRMSPIKAVKKAQIEYQEEAFKVIHNYFHKKYEGEIPDFMGKAIKENFEAVKAKTVVVEELFGDEIKLSFLDRELPTKIIDNILYFSPKDICEAMKISYDIQEKVILNDCVLKKHIITDYTNDLLLDTRYIYNWLNHINRNKVGMAKKKVINQKVVDTIEAIQANCAEIIHREMGKELKK